MNNEVFVWREGLSPEEEKNGAYWERNMLALRYADGWYGDYITVVPELHLCTEDQEALARAGIVLKTLRPRFTGWTRVLSLDGGRITFHIPDEFDVGDLPKIEPNWDGHTTKEKWKRVQQMRGIK